MEFLPFYLILFIVFLVGVIDAPFNTSAYKTACFWLILLLLVAFATFRSIGVGSDDEAYVDIFSKVPPITECKSILCGYDYSEIKIEFGFFGLLSILSLLGSSHFILFGTVALLSIYLNLRSISFYSPYLGASTLIYFSHFFLAKELNAIRVGLATAITFYATTFLFKKKYPLFLALMVVGLSIHVTSILVLIPVFFLIFSPGRLHLMLISAVMLLIASAYDPIHLINQLVYFDFLQEKMELYGGAQEYSYAIPLLDLVNIRNLVIMFLCLALWEKLSAFGEKFKFAFSFFFCATFFRILFGDFAILAGRGYAAISMFEYIIIPFLFIAAAGKRLGYFLTFVYALLTLYLNLFVSTGWSGGVKYFADFL